MRRKIRLPWRSRKGGNGREQQTASPAVPQSVPNTEIVPYGLDVVAEGHDPIVDIVAIHGLNGHREETWTASNDVHWLRDLLPKDLPHARILCWGYDANTYANSRMSCQYLYDHARTLVSDLCRKRELTDTMQRPIIFIAHSLGGIIVKSALIHSDAARQNALVKHRSIRLSTFGIFFMGTPHQGGNGVQLGRALTNIASVFVAADDHLLRHLERDSEWLQQQLGQYSLISGDFVTKFAYEEYETPTAVGHKIMVVPRSSAVVPGQVDAEPIVIHSDHRGMVRFTSKEDVGYITVSEHLQIMMKSATSSIQSRWEADSRATEARENNKSVGDFSLTLNLPEIMEVTHFVARTKEIERIHEILAKTEVRCTAVVHGLGGMGKTQLAIAYLKRHQSNYSATIWLNARDSTSLQQSFLHAAERIFRQHPQLVYIEAAVNSQNPDESVKAVMRWLDEPRNNRWLLVYDNYDDPDLGHCHDHDDMAEKLDNEHDGVDDEPSVSIIKPYDIRPFLLGSAHGAILITTRSSKVKLGLPVHLRKLENIDDGLEILASTSNRGNLQDDKDAVRIATLLDGLPLALSTAGAYLDQVSTTWAEYLKLYEESWLRLNKATPRLLEYNQAMYSTWNISYKHIKRQNKDAAMLLQLWAYFDNEDLWYELLQEGASDFCDWLENLTKDRLVFDNTMRILCSHGLVDADPATRECGVQSRGYNVHGCVHSWMRHVLNSGPNSDMEELAARCVASCLPDGTEPQFWWVQRRLVRHANQCIKHDSFLVGDDKGWIFYKFGKLYRALGHLGDAETMYEQALQGFEKTLGPDDMSTIDTVRGLGLLYQDQFRFIDSETMLKRAIQGFEKNLGPEDLQTLNTINSLGALYKDQYRYMDAVGMFIRALQGKEKTLERDDIAMFSTLMGLGNLYRSQGRLTESLGMYQRVLQGYEKAYGRDHIRTLDIVNNLGNLYVVQGRLKDAEAMYERALKGKEKALGADHLANIRMFNNLGILYKNQGRRIDADAMYKRALEGYERHLGSEKLKTYPPAIKVLINIGHLLDRWEGRGEEALLYYKRAADGAAIVYGMESVRYKEVVESMRYHD